MPFYNTAANNPAAANPKPVPMYCVKAAAAAPALLTVLALVPVADGDLVAETVELEAVPLEAGEVGLEPAAQEALVGRVTW
jgi:hypothetical protein